MDLPCQTWRLLLLLLLKAALLLLLRGGVLWRQGRQQ
jgi:hypothetical protein